MNAAGPDAAHIAAELNARIAQLARELVGEPNQQLSSPQQLRFNSKGSISVEIAGPKAGRWYDYEADVGGDGLELICHRLGFDRPEALDWAREWLGRPALPSAQPRARRGDSAEQRAAKVRTIIAETRSVDDTPAQAYLRRRGITAMPPDCIRFREGAWSGHGALVALATDAAEEIAAVQQVYLGSDGSKAELDVKKRTNGSPKGAAVRLPGETPLILCEGVEDALTIWQATGRETWACLGVSNIAHAPLPDGVAVVVAGDNDNPGTPAEAQLDKAIHRLVARGHSVSVVKPHEVKDFNDLLLAEGEAAVREAVQRAEPLDPTHDEHPKRLDLGSDVEIAGRVRDELVEAYGHLVYAEGDFWRFGGTHWEMIPSDEMRRIVHGYDGAQYGPPSNRRLPRIKLGQSRITSILNECAALCAKPDFFEVHPTGINCASGFIRFHDNGSATIEPHDPDHRCRHTLPGRWNPEAVHTPPEVSLLGRFIDGIFRGDDDAAEKAGLLAEISGCAALGYATKLIQPRAVVLFGRTAENGKSQVLDLVRGLLPPSAVSAVSAGRMGDERHITGLVGKLLNATDELSAAAISSDTFKAVVTGEPIDGREAYRARVEFRSVAQNLFATNTLPPFKGGIDRGVARRLLVIPFDRTIPMEERIEGIGRRIAEEEADLLLAWAVAGASRLIKQRNFTIPPSSEEALRDWIYGADPVLAWLDQCTTTLPVNNGEPKVRTRDAYVQFFTWATNEGYRNLPSINGFTQRILANAHGVKKTRDKTGRFFVGLRMTHEEHCRWI